MYMYEYTIDSAGIWTSFDHGTVIANNEKEAREKALKQLQYDFDKANVSLDYSDNTQGFEVSFDPRSISIELVQYVGRSWIVTWLKDKKNKMSSDFSVHESLEAAKKVYDKLLQDDRIHSASITVVVKSTDYEPVNTSEFIITTNKLK